MKMDNKVTYSIGLSERRFGVKMTKLKPWRLRYLICRHPEDSGIFPRFKIMEIQAFLINPILSILTYNFVTFK
jgi:hypothetical protein